MILVWGTVNIAYIMISFPLLLFIYKYIGLYTIIRPIYIYKYIHINI